MQTVKALAEALGVSPDVVRHYTEFGLISPVTNSENKYKYYDEIDFLQLANTRVLRSLGFSLPSAMEYEKASIEEQKEILQSRALQVRKQIEKLQKLEERLFEIERYLKKTSLCTPSVEEVSRQAIYSLYTYGNSSLSQDKKKIAKVWAEHFPFTHISLKIPKDELLDPNFEGPYTVSIGLGVISKYAEQFSLETKPPVEAIPGGRFLIIYLKVPDLFNICRKDLEPMFEKAKQLGVHFTHQSSGRLLAIEGQGKESTFFILIRVRIEDD